LVPSSGALELFDVFRREPNGPPHLTPAYVNIANIAGTQVLPESTFSNAERRRGLPESQKPVRNRRASVGLQGGTDNCRNGGGIRPNDIGPEHGAQLGQAQQRPAALRDGPPVGWFAQRGLDGILHRVICDFGGGSS
jgi:hypothetical protein